ncbi:aminoacyl-tRNA deacylase and HDOD domain-containing protein [Agaribacterium haliotis]|uniref:aminoacyl-tRNA deacylase and HDOD domain-containing protein n=1 Tax=Agaribacterium haliotis TaxID=2013869 RepID=UPI001304220D|nr:HDOD domain-containing protein [Agaribacterium haliotis]
MDTASQLERWLNSNKFAYNLGEACSRLALANSSETLVRACLLRHHHESEQNYVLVLIPTHHVLELSQLALHFGGHFDGLNPDQLPRALQRAPAMPGWQALNCYIDTSLFNYKTLYLDSGNPNDSIKLSLEDFKQAVANMPHASFSHPLRQSTKNLRQSHDFNSRRLRQRLDETLELPIMRHSSEEILRQRNAPRDSNALCRIVENDPSLALQVVSWASSPYYAAPTKVKSVRDAIDRVLGYDKVLNLCLCLASHNQVKGLDQLQLELYAHNASLTAHCCTALAAQIRQGPRLELGLARMTGLLRNFGQLLIAELFPLYHRQIRRVERANVHIGQSGAQTEIIGVSGDALACYLFESWSLPEEIITALTEQHKPDYRGEHQRYAQLLRCASALLAEQGLVNGPLIAVDDELHQLGIRKEDADSVLEHCRILGEQNRY